jgi:putative acetyltransferase
MEYGLQPDPEGTDADLKNVAVSYQLPGGLFDVLMDETGEIVGTIGLFPVTKDRCELRKMYLARRVRGLGYGRRLLEHALTEATTRRFHRLELETASVLVEAIALYEQYGFHRFTPNHLAPRCDCAYYLTLTPSEP